VNEFLSSRRRTWWLVPAGSGAEVDRRVIPDHAGTVRSYASRALATLRLEMTWEPVAEHIGLAMEERR
jgi:hypothetical protein